MEESACVARVTRPLCYLVVPLPRGDKEAMRRSVAKGFLVWMLCSAAAAISMRALADEWPMTQGDFWEVTGVHISRMEGRFRTRTF